MATYLQPVVFNSLVHTRFSAFTMMLLTNTTMQTGQDGPESFKMSVCVYMCMCVCVRERENVTIQIDWLNQTNNSPVRRQLTLPTERLLSERLRGKTPSFHQQDRADRNMRQLTGATLKHTLTTLPRTKKFSQNKTTVFSSFLNAILVLVFSCTF